MILTRHEILTAIDKKDVSFDPPLDQFQLQPHAIDLRLGYTFLIPKNWTIDEHGRRAIKISIDDVNGHREQFDEVVLKPGQYFELLPNEFVIGTSLESIEINAPNLMAILFPRTSTNRRGIDLSLSGIIDNGYKGKLIFPMKNEAGDQVIRVYPGERVCQVIFEELISPLTIEEANLHGMNAAKYTNLDSGAYRLDKDEERQHLIKGTLEDMKEKHKINT
jgi:dCTP deaminase